MLALLRRLPSTSLTMTRQFAAKKAKGGAVTRVKVFDVETDVKKLVTHCCGLNYRVDEAGKSGEDVKLKPDSEYPDWLWQFDTTMPRPESKDMEYGTMEYFLKRREEHQQRRRRVAKMRRKLHMHGGFKLTE